MDHNEGTYLAFGFFSCLLVFRFSCFYFSYWFSFHGNFEMKGKWVYIYIYRRSRYLISWLKENTHNRRFFFFLNNQASTNDTVVTNEFFFSKRARETDLSHSQVEGNDNHNNHQRYNHIYIVYNTKIRHAHGEDVESTLSKQALG